MVDLAGDAPPSTQPAPQPEVMIRPPPDADVFGASEDNVRQRAVLASATSWSECPAVVPPARRRRLTGKQPADRLWLATSRSHTPVPAQPCLGGPPREGTRGDPGQRRTAVLHPHSLGVGEGSRQFAHRAEVLPGATGTNGGCREAPLLGSRAPRLQASCASSPHTPVPHGRSAESAGAGEPLATTPGPP